MLLRTTIIQVQHISFYMYICIEYFYGVYWNCDETTLSGSVMSICSSKMTFCAAVYSNSIQNPPKTPSYTEVEPPWMYSNCILGLVLKRPRFSHTQTQTNSTRLTIYRIPRVLFGPTLGDMLPSPSIHTHTLIHRSTHTWRALINSCEHMCKCMCVWICSLKSCYLEYEQEEGVSSVKMAFRLYSLSKDMCFRDTHTYTHIPRKRYTESPLGYLEDHFP